MVVAAPRQLAQAVTQFGIFLKPPAYTRLEPQSVTGDPTPGIEAAMHDPLWALFRQWQVGEFAGESAGTPLAVTIETHTQPLTLFSAGAPDLRAGIATTLAGEPIGNRASLDRMIEAEPPVMAGSRQRAEAAAILIAALGENGLDVADALHDAFPFGPDDTGVLSRPALSIMLRRGADAEGIARALEAGVADWLAAGTPAARAAADDWLGWYRSAISPDAGGDCWDPARLEYHFSIATEAGPAQKTFTAPMHLGGDIDWHALDQIDDTMSGGETPRFRLPDRGALRGGLFQLDGPPTALVAPLRFAGMAADRFWEFEDGNVNFGGMSVQANDPARLCLMEFATIYGCDWFLAPVEIPASGFTTVTTLTVIDSFGKQTQIPRADTGAPGARFRLFETSIAASGEALLGLLTIGGARGAIDGPPRESVLFLRDESANMVWGVEALVEDASGIPRRRQDEARVVEPLPAVDSQADLRYSLETQVPRHWIPFVPVPLPNRANGFILRKGTMNDQDDSVGRIVAGKPRDLFDPEVPRGGIRVSRIPSLARNADGHPVRWTAFRMNEGVGDVSSGFASDVTDAK